MLTKTGYRNYSHLSIPFFFFFLSSWGFLLSSRPLVDARAYVFVFGYFWSLKFHKMMLVT